MVYKPIFRIATQPYCTNSTVESLNWLATAAHIHLDIKIALSRTDRSHNFGITKLLYI